MNKCLYETKITVLSFLSAALKLHKLLPATFVPMQCSTIFPNSLFPSFLFVLVICRSRALCLLPFLLNRSLPPDNCSQDPRHVKCRLTSVPTFPTFPYFLIQSPTFPYFLRKQPYYPYFLGCHVVKLNKEHLKHVFLH